LNSDVLTVSYLHLAISGNNFYMNSLISSVHRETCVVVYVNKPTESHYHTTKLGQFNDRKK